MPQSKRSEVDRRRALLEDLDVKKALLGRTRELAALLAISQTATQSLETDKILNDTLDKSLEILDFDVGYIRTLDAEKKNLIVRVARGLSSPEFLRTSFPLDSTDPIVGKIVFKTQKPSLLSQHYVNKISCLVSSTVFSASLNCESTCKIGVFSRMVTLKICRIEYKL